MPINQQKLAKNWTNKYNYIVIKQAVRKGLTLLKRLKKQN